MRIFALIVAGLGSMSSTLPGGKLVRMRTGRDGSTCASAGGGKPAKGQRPQSGGEIVVGRVSWLPAPRFKHARRASERLPADGILGKDP
jgi:hypothetical protein